MNCRSSCWRCASSPLFTTWAFAQPFSGAPRVRSQACWWIGDGGQSHRRARPWIGYRDGLAVVPLDLFASAAFNDQALFALGAASSQSAEAGEVLRITQTINARTADPAEPGTGAFDAYCDVFRSFGDELARRAASSGDGSREEPVFDRAQSRWMRAVALFEPRVQHSEVDSVFGSIPVHFFPSPSGSGRRPTVIISEGSDGQNVETMQFGVTAALARGYNVVLFEGPGQMTPLFKRSVMFTPNWNRVVAPVLAWSRERADVGKVALVGISFGGMLCARAAARVLGLEAVVLEPAAHDFTALWGDQKSMALVKETYRAPAADKEGARRGLNAGFVAAWPSLPRIEQFTIYKRGSIFDRRVQREARAGKPLSDYYALLEAMLPFRFGRDFRKISIPTLVLANEGDQAFGTQPEEAVFDWLDDHLR